MLKEVQFEKMHLKMYKILIFHPRKTEEAENKAKKIVLITSRWTKRMILSLRPEKNIVMFPS